jgi:hypothetical protein
LLREAMSAIVWAMSFTATVENDTIKLPEGVHLPDGTEVVVEPRRRSVPSRGPMRDVPDFVARQKALGMQMLSAEVAERLDKLIRGEDV